MKTWIWPLSWYFRIRQLERERDAWKAVAEKWEREVRGAYFAQTSMAVAYSNAMASMASMVQQANSSDGI